MELCTNPAFSNAFPSPISHGNSHRILATRSANLSSNSQYLVPRRTSVAHPAIGRYSRKLFFNKSLARAAFSEETSSVTNKYDGDERVGAVILEDVQTIEKNLHDEPLQSELAKEETRTPIDEQMQGSDILSKLDIKLDSEDSLSFLLYGGGSIVVGVWLASAVVGAIDSIPVLPKLMEVVGLGYSVWFSSRYLIFKNNRDELATRIKELKQQVLGSKDE